MEDWVQICLAVAVICAVLFGVAAVIGGLEAVWTRYGGFAFAGAAATLSGVCSLIARAAYRRQNNGV